MENITVFNGSQPLKIGLPLHDVDTIHSEVWRQTLMIVPLPAMIVYDYIMTIPEEINVLWRRKKTFSSLALLVNRYGLLLLAISLVSLLFPVYGDLMTNKDSNAELQLRCRVGIPVGSAAMILVLVSVISFDTLRIYAIMQKSILAGLSVTALGVTWLVLWIITPAQKGFVATFSNGAQLGCQGKLIILPTNVHTVSSRERYLNYPEDCT
ncbi:hypothetical protein QCA50_015178 [Cerrena zonata]|uniref:DUF6533 domain-containing protein n=1 Tax=Cerrena zonata TaxID=2478898 RepID=A0AAW0FMC4_9APHY